MLEIYQQTPQNRLHLVSASLWQKLNHEDLTRRS